MKRLLFVAAGLAIALSVSAQNNPDENKDQKEKKERAKTEQAAPGAETKGAKAGPQAHEHGDGQAHQGDGMQTKQREPKAGGDEPATQSKTRESTKVDKKTRTSAGSKQEGATVRATTVFRGGKQTNEKLTLRRTTREKTDVHFSIGHHPRDWWLRTYTIVLLEGCYYYLADNGCWYPAYGFDPGCTFPVGVVFCP
jgi:hypothetical protein